MTTTPVWCSNCGRDFTSNRGLTFHHLHNAVCLRQARIALGVHASFLQPDVEPVVGPKRNPSFIGDMPIMRGEKRKEVSHLDCDLSKVASKRANRRGHHDYGGGPIESPDEEGDISVAMENKRKRKSAKAHKKAQATKYNVQHKGSWMIRHDKELSRNEEEEQMEPECHNSMELADSNYTAQVGKENDRLKEQAEEIDRLKGMLIANKLSKDEKNMWKSAEAKDQEIDRLKRMMAVKKLSKDEKNKWKGAIQGAIRNRLWRRIKFVTTFEQETKFAEMVYDNIDLEMHYEKEAWVNRFKGLCLTLLNDTRQYVQSRLKEWAESYMDGHDGKLPTLAEITMIIKRDINCAKTEELFRMWWDTILPLATANTHDWAEDKRYYATISQAHYPGKPKMLYVPPHTEAFVALTFMGCLEKWEAMWKLRKENPDLANKKIALGKKRKPKGDEKGWEVRENLILCTDPKFFSTITKTDGGQTKYGGYTPEAMKTFNSMVDLLVRYRDMSSVKATEEKMLNSLRQDKDLQGQSHDEDRRRKKLKNKANNQEETTTPMVPACWDEDE